MLEGTVQKSNFKIRLAFLAGAVAVLPWFFDSKSLDPNLAPRLSFLSIVLLVLALLQFKMRQIKVPSLFWLFVAFLGLEALSVFFANSPSEVFFPLLRDGSMVLLFLYVYQLVEQPQSKIILARAIMLASLAMVAYAIFQIFQFDAWGEKEKLYEISSLMAHRNLLASALLLALPWLLFTIIQPNLPSRIVAILVLSSSVALIYFLESRTVWLALVSSLVAFFMAPPFSKLLVRIKPKKLLITGLLVLLAVTLSFTFLKYQNRAVNKKAQELKTSLNISAEAEKNFTVSERVLLWKASLNMIWDSECCGVGAGNWKIYFPAYGSDIWRARQGMVQFQRPHNDFIWVLAELGILGLLLYISIFINTFSRALHNLASANTQSERLFTQLLISGLVAYLVISFFSFPRERIFHQVILFINLAYLVGHSKVVEIGLRGTKGLMLITSLFSLAVLAFALNWWRGERIIIELNQARAKGEWQRLVEKHESLADNYFYQIDAVSLPISFYAGLAELNLQNYPLSEKYFEAAYDLHPYNIHVINNLANIKLLNNQTDTAIYFYKEALKVSPKYLDGALNLMAGYFNTNRVEEAYLVLCQYEKVFAVDDPDNPSLPEYRRIILKAMYTRELNLGFTSKPLDEKDLENAHFEALAQKQRLFN